MVLDGSSKGRRVLIVEDQPLIAMEMENMLIGLGHLVTATATRIEKALSLAEGSEFDLAVLDINLAESNTFQVAAILRKRGIPFIFTSGYGRDGLIDGYRGANLLTKPFGSRELEHMIAQSVSADAT